MANRKEMLAKESIGKLLLKLSMPATIAMLVQSLYNVVDTIFVGRIIGRHGIGALTIAFPIQILIMALGMTVGLGGASIISRALGKDESELANKTFGNIIILTIIPGIMLAILATTFLQPILRIFGAIDNIMLYATQYMRIIFISAPVFTTAIALNNVVRSEGNARVAMNTMLIGAFLNIALDAIFIYVFDWGIQGAAAATVLSQFVGFTYLAYYFIAGKSLLKVGIEYIKFDLQIVKEILAIGSSALARQSAGSIVAIVLNNSLGFFGGEIAISAFGIMNRVIMFIMMPMFGVVQGLQPIVGFNYGANDLKRVRKTLKITIIITTTYCFTGFLIIQLFTKQVVSIFTNDLELINLSTSGLRIITLAFVFIGVQIIGAGFYQATGKALKGFVLSISRQLIFLIPLVLVLSQLFEITGIWIAFPIADLLSFLLTIIIFRRDYKKL